MKNALHSREVPEFSSFAELSEFFRSNSINDTFVLHGACGFYVVYVTGPTGLDRVHRFKDDKDGKTKPYFPSAAPIEVQEEYVHNLVVAGVSLPLISKLMRMSYGQIERITGRKVIE